MGVFFILLIDINNIEMEYGEKELYSIPSLQVHSGDRIGIIGVNGSGKSTLLDIIAGYIQPQNGYAILYHDISYIQQIGNSTMGDIELSQNIKWGTIDNPKSGGEIMRHKIAAAFSQRAKILLCDEPTSNLDNESIELLENSLSNFNGCILLVSHDRKLLNTVCNYIWEIDDNRVSVYRGNYDDFKIENEKAIKNKRKEYDKYLAKKHNLEQAAARANEQASRMTSAPSRMGISEARLHKMDIRQRAGIVSGTAKQYRRRLDRLDVKEMPTHEIKYKMTVANDECKTSKTAVRVEHLSFGYGDNLVLDDVSLSIGKGERVAITGVNGSGKSTLLNAIVNKLDSTAISPNYTVGYFNQDVSNMPAEVKVLDYVMETSCEPQHVVRTVLGHLGIKREEVFKKLGVLSGGERCKVKLTQLIVNGCSILILDEPTNYLDIYVLEALEQMLIDYSGTLIVVSPDRYFLERVTNREIRIENTKAVDAEKARQMQKKNDNDILLLEFRKSQLIQLLAEPINEEQKNKYEIEYKEVMSSIENMNS